MSQTSSGTPKRLKGAPQVFPCGCATGRDGRNQYNVMILPNGHRICKAHGRTWKPTWEEVLTPQVTIEN